MQRMSAYGGRPDAPGGVRKRRELAKNRRSRHHQWVSSPGVSVGGHRLVGDVQAGLAEVVDVARFPEQRRQADFQYPRWASWAIDFSGVFITYWHIRIAFVLCYLNNRYAD